MYLRNRFANNPRLLMMLGMFCLLLAVLPRFIRIFAPGFTMFDVPLTSDQSDFALGLLMGVSIGLLLLAVWWNAQKNHPAS